MSRVSHFLLGVRRQETPFQRAIYNAAKHTRSTLRTLRLPFPRVIGSIFFLVRRGFLTAWRRTMQFFFWEPMFRYRCARVGKSLYLEAGFPLVIGYGSLEVGDRVYIAKNVTFVVAYKVKDNPTVFIDDDAGTGFGTIFICGDKIHVGKRVMIAHGCQIFDNNTHAIHPESRRLNLPVEPHNVKPVIIEDDAWLGAYTIVMKGVRIGSGSIVAAGSVVTRDIPPMSIAAGNPAKVVRLITDEDRATASSRFTLPSDTAPVA